MSTGTLDPEKVLRMPFTELLLGHVKQSQDGLIDAAMLSFSCALGNDPSRLTSDKDYARFVALYITDTLMPYVFRVATPSLGLINQAFAGDSTAALIDNFREEITKVRSQLLLDEQAANTIINDPARLMYFFMAVVALMALHCQGSPAMAKEAFGLQRGFFGGWKIVQNP